MNIIILLILCAVGLNFNHIHGLNYINSRLLNKLTSNIHYDNPNNTIQFGSVLATPKIFIGSNKQDVYININLDSSEIHIVGDNCIRYADPDDQYHLDGELVSISQEYSYTTTAHQTTQTTDVYTTDTSDSYQQSSEKLNYRHPYSPSYFNKGVWAHDSISFLDGYVKNVSIAIINETNYGDKFGLGLPLKPDSLLSQLKAQGFIKKLVYSLNLNYYDASVLFGAIDHSRYKPPLVTIPMYNHSESEINVILSKININRNVLESVSIDTSKYITKLRPKADMNLVPRPVFDQIVKNFNAKYSDSNQLYMIACPYEKKFSLQLDFNGIKLDATSGVSKFLNEEMCFLNFLPSDDNIIMLGRYILNDGYFVFDLQDFEISIANLNPDRLGVSSIPTAKPTIETIYSTVPSATRFFYDTTSMPSSPQVTPSGSPSNSFALSTSELNPIQNRNLVILITLLCLLFV